MNKNSKFFCIPIIVLAGLSFMIGLIACCIMDHTEGIIGSVLFSGAIVFSVFAMIKKPYFIIGTLISDILYGYLLSLSSYYSYYYYDYGTMICYSIVKDLFLPIISVLALIYLIWSICNARQAQSVVSTTKPENAKASPDSANAITQAPQQASLVVAQKLMTYKNLLDTGVLTQEEFDAIKHRLLK